MGGHFESDANATGKFNGHHGGGLGLRRSGQFVRITRQLDGDKSGERLSRRFVGSQLASPLIKGRRRNAFGGTELSDGMASFVESIDPICLLYTSDAADDL